MCRVMISDAKVFKFIVKVGKFWGPFPIDGNCCTKICYFTIAFMFSVLSLISSVSEFKGSTIPNYLNVNVSDVYIFMLLCNLIILIHYLYCTYYGKCCNKNSWNNFFVNIETLDEFSTERNLITYLLKIICILAIFFFSTAAIMNSGGFLDFENWYSKLTNFFWALCNAQLFYVIVFWWETCTILSSRYKYINNTVKKIYSEDISVRQESIKEIVHVQVFSIIVIMSCDKVEKKASEFIQTCINKPFKY
uniref:Uncharacterized protein LOC114342551 n=1 Tax=Diabrotica virgifera virgifera TaxID=50390 RepID=A0A6P7GH55_DIAVI